MKRWFSFSLLLSLCVVAPSASGAPKKAPPPKAEAAPAAPSEPPLTKIPIRIVPFVVWGASPADVAGVYDRVLEEDFRPKYKNVPAGLQQQRIDAQLVEEKAAFRRSRIDFGRLPTGLDATPLRGEYSYNNGESLMSITRNGQTRYFFFIKDRLWKVIDERKLGADSTWGGTFADAVTKLATNYGIPGRAREADGKDRFYAEADWRDGTTHLRAIHRGPDSVAIAAEELATLANLDQLRANKNETSSDLDPSVASALRKPEAETGPIPEEEKKQDPKKDKSKRKKP